MSEQQVELEQPSGERSFPHSQISMGEDEYEGEGEETARKVKIKKRKRKKEKRKDDQVVLPQRKVLQWWERPAITYAFSHPHIRTKLEKLMGSNMVLLTDRQYMVCLQERILQDYAHAMDKRIADRQLDEMERVKNLVLMGKIPLEQAPPEMANHPVMLIDQYCKKVLAERRAKIKQLKPYIPKYLYWDDTPDPPSGLSIEAGHVLRKDNDRLCIPPDLFLAQEESENIADGYMMTDEEYERIKFESEFIKELQNCETVEEMYALADAIIGVLKTLGETARPIEVAHAEE